MLDFIFHVLSGAIFVMAVIAGVGPQSLTILTHGVLKNYYYEVGLTCFLADTILILAGCLGLKIAGSFIILAINIIGVVFLSYYLIGKIKNMRLKEAFKVKGIIYSRKQAITRALAVTWLNPLVFIDTIVVIGGTSAQYNGINNTAFIIGAVLGDFVWVMGLAFLSYKFSNKLNRPYVWLMLDIITIILVAIILCKIVMFYWPL